VNTLEGPGPGPSRNWSKPPGSPARKTRNQPRHPQYTYAFNEKGFPTRITTVRTYAGTTTTSDMVYEYDCE
jgi:hypothetical protein